MEVNGNLDGVGGIVGSCIFYSRREIQFDFEVQSCDELGRVATLDVFPDKQAVGWQVRLGPVVSLGR
jgi:hypothetical protein